MKRSWYPPTDEDDVMCPVCAGTGYEVEHDGARDWCDECGASGVIHPIRAHDLAEEVHALYFYPRD